MNAPAEIRRAVQEGLRLAGHRASCAEPAVTTKLVEAYKAGHWSWNRADTIVMDTFDEIDWNDVFGVAYTISPSSSARIVRAVDDALPEWMKLTVTAADDRVVYRDSGKGTT